MDELKSITQTMRRDIIAMAWRSKTAHIGSALGIVEILAALFFRILKIRPEEPEWPGRDRFILSKGHAAAALYAVLAARGFFPKQDLEQYCRDGGIFQEHPCRGAAPGIETSTGSLGHGLSVAAGMAMALQHSQNKIYILLSDGECNEGSVWEAAAFIAVHNLKNIVVIVEDNKWQGFGPTSTTSKTKLEEQWQGFGWLAERVDGHDLEVLEKSLRRGGDGANDHYRRHSSR
jgi:transketolase